MCVIFLGEDHQAEPSVCGGVGSTAPSPFWPLSRLAVLSWLWRRAQTERKRENAFRGPSRKYLQQLKLGFIGRCL